MAGEDRSQRRRPGTTSLDSVRPGGILRIVAIDDPRFLLQALRLGLGPGTEVGCRSNSRLGPVILSCHGREVAVGRELARRIMVVPLEGKIGGRTASRPRG